MQTIDQSTAFNTNILIREKRLRCHMRSSFLYMEQLWMPTVVVGDRVFFFLVLCFVKLCLSDCIFLFSHPWRCPFIIDLWIWTSFWYHLLSFLSILLYLKTICGLINRFLPLIWFALYVLRVNEFTIYILFPAVYYLKTPVKLYDLKL